MSAAETEGVGEDGRDTKPVPGHRRDTFLRIVRWPVGLLFVAVGGVAGWLGFRDASHPIYLSVQVVALSYVLGAIATIGAAGVMIFGDGAPRRWGAVLTGIAGGYIAASFALYARSYRPVWLWVFGLIAVVGLVLIAVAARSSDLQHASKLAGTLGISVAVIFTGAQLWYASIYEPRNTDISVSVNATAGTPHRISRSVVLLPVTLQIDNHSSMTAVALNSLFTATAVRYHQPLESASETDQNAIDVGLAAGTTPQSKNVNFASSSDRVTRRLVAISRVVGDDSYILPNATLDTPIDLELPPGNFQELDVGTTIDYARTSRVSLGSQVQTFHQTKQNAQCVDARWQVRESRVLSFLRGPETLVVDWCTGPDPYIETYFGGAPTQPFSASTVSRNDAAAAFIHSSKVSMFPIQLPPEPPRHKGHTPHR